MSRAVKILIYTLNDNLTPDDMVSYDVCICKNSARKYACSKHRYLDPTTISSENLKKLIETLGL